jgi:hypothetical protein
LQVNGCVAEFFRRMAARLKAFMPAGLKQFVTTRIWGRVGLEEARIIHPPSPLSSCYRSICRTP